MKSLRSFNTSEAFKSAKSLRITTSEALEAVEISERCFYESTSFSLIGIVESVT